MNNELSEYTNGKFLFHGSDRVLKVLLPKQQKTMRDEILVNDGKPAVCATETLDIAIFRALTACMRGQKGYKSSFSTEGPNKIKLRLAGDFENELKQSKGYVHVLDRKDFKFERGYEWRSLKAVWPVEVISVSYSDIISIIEYI
ncbi:MAG: hypothetical protein Q7S37_01325 [bacterium]|nr:hypothetical protein [bacterium]